MNTKKQNNWWMWLILGIILVIISGVMASDGFLGSLISIFGICFIIASIIEGVRASKKGQELKISSQSLGTYCEECGTKQESMGKFCYKCGKNNDVSK